MQCLIWSWVSSSSKFGNISPASWLNKQRQARHAWKECANISMYYTRTQLVLLFSTKETDNVVTGKMGSDFRWAASHFLFKRIRLQTVRLTARHRNFSEEDETSTFLPTNRGEENRQFNAAAATVVRLTTTHWDTAEIWIWNANCGHNAGDKRQARKYQLGCLESPVNLINIISGENCENVETLQDARQPNQWNQHLHLFKKTCFVWVEEKGYDHLLQQLSSVSKLTILQRPCCWTNEQFMRMQTLAYKFHSSSLWKSE